MTYTKKQQDALSRANPQQRESMKKLFASQARPAESAIPMPKFGAAPKPKPTPKKKAWPKKQGNPPRKPVNRGQKQVQNKVERYVPLPLAESGYLVLELPNVYPVNSAIADDLLVTVNSLRKVNTTNPYDDSVVTDYVATLKNASQPVLSTVFSALRCAIGNTPVLTAENQYNNRRIRLHAMSATIKCIGVASGLYPVGEVWIGKTYMPDFYDRSNPETPIQNCIVQPLIQSGKMVSFSAVDLFKPARVDAAPADVSTHQQWCDLTIESTATNPGYLEPHIGLESILFYIPKTAIVVQYRIEIKTVWCVRDTSDTIINSSLRTYTPSKLDTWNSYVARLRNAKPHHVSA